MDLTTLAIAVLLGLGLLGADTVINSGSVSIEVAIAPKVDTISVDEPTLAAEFQDQFDAISSTQSLVRPMEIRSRDEQGIGMALAESLNAQKVGYALQRQFGFKPDTIRFTLFVDNGALRGLVHGHSHLIGNINQVMVPLEGEALIPFVQRCALWSASQLAPYSTALHLLQKHAVDGDFTDVIALIHRAKALLPPTPISFDRALFDNLLGLVALFKKDPHVARKAFDDAMFGDPTNPVPFLNAALTDMELDDNRKAADRMEALLRIAPPENHVLLATTYLTLGAARLGLRDIPGADEMLAKAVEANPQSATAFTLWAEAKQLEGDQAAADRLERKAREASATFENYAEIAALYFHLSWRNGEPLTRNKFSNPGIVTFH
jgi:tetratricopeptide (TPR) repeat protein